VKLLLDMNLPPSMADGAPVTVSPSESRVRILPLRRS